MLLTTVITLLALNTVWSQKPSPCPEVLIYESQNSQSDRWYAVVNLRTRESLKGLWLTITLDRPAQLLGNIFGDATTSNNRDFLIRSNNNYILEADTVTPVRFFVKHGPAAVPSVAEINLNGRTICSSGEEQTTSRNYVRPTSNSSNRRPTNRNNRPSSTRRPNSNNRPTSITELERPNRPSTSNNRPSSVDLEEVILNDSNSTSPTDYLYLVLPNKFADSNKPLVTEDLESENPNETSSNGGSVRENQGVSSSTVSRRPSHSELDSATLNRPSSSNNRPQHSELDLATPNRPSSSNNRPPHSELDLATSNRPSSSNNRSPNSDLGLLIQNRPTNSNDRAPNSDFEIPNRPSSSLTFTDGLETARPYRPLSVEVNRPSRPSNTNDQGFDRPGEGYRPGFIDEGSNLNGSNRETDDFETNLNSNQGSSSLSTQDEDFFAGDFSAIVSKPPPNPSIRPSVQRNKRCGVVATQPRPLISYGQETEPGQWPWHVALYHSKGIRLMYTCGGTLISNSHILTAAHCVTRPRTNRPIDPQNILAYLGKYNLRKFGSEIQDREIGDIYIHPQYNHSGYYNDIAVLRLSEPVEITNYVRPVCLWEEPDDLNEVEGKLGTVVGWGFNENGVLTTTLMQAQMPIVSLAQCIYSNRDFFSQFTSEKSYCAGFRNGTSVCNGDSGGSMVFPKKGTSGRNTIWQIRGIISVGVAFQGKILCDTSQYVVFTDVAKHSDWIQTILSSYP